MSKRNALWLLIVIAVGAVLWISVGVVVGLIGAGATLLVSEVVERRTRARRRAALDESRDESPETNEREASQARQHDR